MTARRGEKIGWTVGWLGGFLWVLVLAVVFLVQGKSGPGLAGLALTAAAVAGIVFFAPWRFPATPYWRLMLFPLVMFFLSVVWAIWAYGGLEAGGLRWWNLGWLLPPLLPVAGLGRRRWLDGSAG
ncbi:MAG: hypothetical protein ACOY4H_05725 [Thermodesulfobacteriota bacterium]